MPNTSNKKITLSDVLRFISTAEQDELVTITRTCSACIKTTVREIKYDLNVGSKVQWDGKYGQRHLGTITGIRGKTARVTENGGRLWRVAVILLHPQKNLPQV